MELNLGYHSPSACSVINISFCLIYVHWNITSGVFF